MLDFFQINDFSCALDFDFESRFPCVLGLNVPEILYGSLL